MVLVILRTFQGDELDELKYFILTNNHISFNYFFSTNCIY